MLTTGVLALMILSATLLGLVLLGVHTWRRHREEHPAAEQHARMERALAETSERYRSLFDYNPNAVFSLDLDGHFEASNAASERLSGYSIDELRRLEMGVLILSSRATETAAAFAKALNREPQQVETALTHKDGHVVDLSVTGLPIIVGDEVVGIYCIAEDITERKHLERELMRTQLFAEQANEDKSLFLANVSHEIRTPLTTLLGTNEILMDTDLDPRQTRFVDTMHRSGERLLALVTDILDFSKMEAGRAHALTGPVDLRAVLGEVAALVTPAAAGRGVDLQVAVDSAVPPMVLGDGARIAQVLTNLLDNAVKFTEDGWIRASVSTTTATPGSVDVRFVVADSGIGMSAEQQFRLFDSFSQADASITRKYSGTGLGLALCKQLVNLMGGSISVQSTLGEGSTFSVVLPLGTG